MPIVIAAGVIAAGAVAGAAISSSAAKSAASKQAATAAAAAQQQKAAGQQAVSLNEQQLKAAQALLQPYNAEGQVGLNSLNSKLNYLTTPFTPTLAQLAATPGYKFALQQGLLSTQNAQAAQGLGVSGSALKSAANFATGLAQNTYAQDASIYQQNQQQIGNLLTGIIGGGQNAATAMGQEALGFTGNSSNALVGQANNAAQTQLTGAAASAAGTVGAANAWSSALNSIGQSTSQAAILNSLLNQNKPANSGGTTVTSGSSSSY